MNVNQQISGVLLTWRQQHEKQALFFLNTPKAAGLLKKAAWSLRGEAVLRLHCFFSGLITA